MNRVILSIHLYAQWTTQDGRPAQYSVETYLPQFQALPVPVIIGEFGWSGESVPYNPRTLVNTANAMDMGWLFWAWYCNADEPQFNASTAPDTFDLTEAGQFLVNDPENGLKALAQKRNL